MRLKKAKTMNRSDEDISGAIKKLSKEEWKKLFDLIPEIEKTEKFTKGGGVVKEPDNPDVYIINPVIEKKIVWDFRNIMNELDLLIDFDWMDWDEGREIASNQDFEGRDTITLLKLISAFIRNDHFCEGALAARFEERSIEKILKQIKKNIEG